MVRKIAVACVLLLIALSSTAVSQRRFDQLDPAPYTPGVDANIDLYMKNAKESMPRHTHGSLIERDILTRCEGDPLKPERRGAVLKYANRYCHATLDAGYSTVPTTLTGEQEIFYVFSGEGTITGGGKTAGLSEGICVLVPANLEFTMTNTGSEPLEMLLLAEPVPEGFRVNDEILVRDEDELSFGPGDVHWCMLIKNFFGVQDGLGTLEGCAIIAFNPTTMAQPHSHVEGCEEVWTALSEDAVVLLGKQLREQPPGTAFKVPPDGKTPHATINTTDRQIKYFFWARFGAHKLRE